ncbi:hypothetical protein Patl1_11644 [Pistacia atlantica]|uniref:Uncharacterized protein n=1 Tax=Pistacia atlantica TaxID=434234 RepID=A0ACC1A4Q9_9ROSI|nr:hypothetical protein Patl1_11644 [Pistacia atlantica]
MKTSLVNAFAIVYPFINQRISPLTMK